MASRTQHFSLSKSLNSFSTLSRSACIRLDFNEGKVDDPDCPDDPGDSVDPDDVGDADGVADTAELAVELLFVLFNLHSISFHDGLDLS